MYVYCTYTFTCICKDRRIGIHRAEYIHRQVHKIFQKQTGMYGAKIIMENRALKCLDTYIHTYIHTYVRTYVRTYIQTNIHTYIHTDIHTYVRTIHT